MEVAVHLFQLLQTTLVIVLVLTIKELTVVTVSILCLCACVHGHVYIICWHVLVIFINSLHYALYFSSQRYCS